MAVNFQKFSIPFGQGIDSKTDNFSLPATKLEHLDNGIFTKKISIIKRPGYRALDDETLDREAIQKGRELFALDTSPVMHDGAKLFAYAEGPNKWIDKGALLLPHVSTSFLATTATDQSFVDFAYNDDITAIAYEDSNGVRVTILDTTTGAAYLSDHALSSTGTRVRCIAFKGFIYVLWVETATTELRVQRISSGDPVGTAQAGSIQVVGDISGSTPNYDICLNGTGDYAVFAYCQVSTNEAKVGYLWINGFPASPSNGGLPSVVSNSDLLADVAIAVCVSSLDNTIFVAGQTGTTLSAVWYSPSLFVVHNFATETIDTGVATTSITCCFEPGVDEVSGVQYAWVVWEVSASKSYNYQTKRCRVGLVDLDTVDNSGASTLFRHTGLASRAFNIAEATRQTTFTVASGTQTVGLQQNIAAVTYFYPGGAGLAEWDTIESRYPTCNLVIANAPHKFDDTADANYIAQIAEAKALGFTVLNYITSNYRDKFGISSDGIARDLANIDQMYGLIDNCYDFYSPDGIFVDEVATDGDADDLTYYQLIHDYIKTKGGQALVVFNPGTNFPESMVDMADIHMSKEGTYATYTSFTPSAWMANYPASKFWHVIHTCTEAQMPDAVQRARNNNVKYLYVNDNNLYNDPPSYWNSFCDTVETLNAAAVVEGEVGVTVSGTVTINGGVLVNLAHDSALQPTLFTVSLSQPSIVAKVFPGNAGGLHSRPHLPQVDVVDSVATFGAVYRNRLAVDEGLPVQYTDKNPAIVRLDFDAPQSPPVVFGRAAYIPGGFLWMFDGNEAVESGFHLFPENITAVPSNTTSGTLTQSSTVNYQVYYEAFNDRGERELSTAASGVQVTLGGSDDTVTLTIPTLSLTEKTARIAVTRTVGDGTTRYRVDSPTSPIWNRTDLDTVQFVDVLSDASAAKRELDYTNAEFDHSAPPAAGIIAAGKERIFLADVAGFPDTVIYSKVRQDGTAASFNLGLAMPVDQDGGPITALAVMDDNTIIFKERRIFGFNGPGPSNTGLEGDNFSSAQLITSDVGCISQRSVVVSSQGVFFQSHKGIWLLDRQMGLSYVGADVEAYNDQTITSATLLQDENRIVFLTDSGRTLNYDYFFRQWSTFTNHEGVASCLVDGSYHYLKANGRVRKIAPDYYKDVNTGIRLALETGWIAPFGHHTLWRCKSLYVLGKFRSDAVIRVKIAYNLEEIFVDTCDWNPSDAFITDNFGDNDFGDGIFGQTNYADDSFGAAYFGQVDYGAPVPKIDRVYQFRIHMPRQKVQAIKLRFEDITGGSPGESFELNYLTLEAGKEAELHRLSPSKTIGEA